MVASILPKSPRTVTRSDGKPVRAENLENLGKKQLGIVDSHYEPEQTSEVFGAF
jgi:hypothetical protein